MLQFDHSEIERQVLEFMQAVDAAPGSNINLILDGKIHRYQTIHDKKRARSGAYCIHTDGLPAGFVQDWKNGTKATWHFTVSNATKEQRDYLNSAEYKTKIEALRRQKQEEDSQRQIYAAEQSRILWEQLKPAPENHPYLQAKQVFPYGSRINDEGRLAVPLRNSEGIVQSIQWISPDGIKRFQPDASTKGLFWSVGLDTLTQNSTSTILIGEGFATMAKLYELTGIPSVAAMNCYNMKPVAAIIKEKFPACKLICTADNDRHTQLNSGLNPGLHYANMLKTSGLVLDVVAPDFPQGNNGTDWDDFSLLHGDEDTANFVRNSINDALIPPDVKIILPKITRINAQDLRKKVFSPIKWAVPGFLPEGLSILAGGPKVGKSILALHIAQAVALGGCALGKIPCTKGQVLYLALEDTQRRLQDRINGGDFADEDNVDLSFLDIITEIPRQNLGGSLFIEYWLSTHKQARLVIIDTLQMFRKLLTGKGSMYAEDYETTSAIKKISDSYRVPFLALHHLKKGMEGDWLSEISGSQGIAGAADTIFSLKRERNSTLATLHRTGRDVEEQDFIMKLDGFGWTLQDDLEAFTMPEWKRQIMDFLKSNPSVTPIQLSEAYGLNINTAKSNLIRLTKEGLIRKTGYGTYGLPEA